MTVNIIVRGKAGDRRLDLLLKQTFEVRRQEDNMASHQSLTHSQLRCGAAARLPGN